MNGTPCLGFIPTFLPPRSEMNFIAVFAFFAEYIY
jgi:hypothetical protein